MERYYVCSQDGRHYIFDRNSGMNFIYQPCIFYWKLDYAELYAKSRNDGIIHSKCVDIVIRYAYDTYGSPDGGNFARLVDC